MVSLVDNQLAAGVQQKHLNHHLQNNYLTIKTERGENKIVYNYRGPSIKKHDNT